MIYNFTWIRPGRLAGFGFLGGGEAPEVELSALHGMGVGALVSLSEALPAASVAGAGLSYLHLPVSDMEPPRPTQIERFVAFVDESVERGLATAVHCRAGLGRTGTMLASYLVAQGATADQALAEVRARRPGSVETPAQEDAIREFARSLQERLKQRA